MRAGSFREGRTEWGDQQTAYTFVVPDAATSAKVTLAWDDRPAPENALSSLVNDLDLIVLDPSGVRHYPWTLDPAAPSAAAVRTRADHTNNVEQVFVGQADGLELGIWTIIVTKYSVPSGELQPFSLVASGLQQAPLPPLYVAPSGGEANSGRSPSDALPSIQQALDYASDGDEIRLAQGTWAEYGFRLTANPCPPVRLCLSLSGGWTPDFSTSVDDPALTTINASRQGSIFILHATEATLRLSLSRLTLTNGLAGPDLGQGGAIRATANDGTVELTLTHNRFVSNEGEDGGAIHLTATLRKPVRHSRTQRDCVQPSIP